MEAGKIKIGKTTQVLKPKLKNDAWVPTLCPACNAKDISTNYFTGEVFCLKCGLVIY